MLLSTEMATEKSSGGSVEEKTGDMFLAPVPDDKTGKTHLAHCIGGDKYMGAGIALQFRRKWGRPPGGTHDWPVVLRQDVTATTTVHHLVTKAITRGKPTLATLDLALRRIGLPEGTTINAPLIGCGLDRLAWRDVKTLLLQTPYRWVIWVYTPP